MPNFLFEKSTLFTLFLSVIFALSVLWFPAGAVALLIVVLALLAWYKPEHIALSVIATSFFIGAEIWLGKYSTLRDVPFVPQINAPMGDFFGVVFLLCIFFALYRQILERGFSSIRPYFAGFFWYGSFLVCAIVAATSAFNGAALASFYYILRFMVFAYAVYVLGMTIFLNSSEKIYRALRVLFGVGIVIAIFGVLSFFQPWQSGIYRAAPFYIFGMAPLGVNHNVMAEALVAILPFGFLLAMRESDAERRRLFFAGSFLMTAIALLTLSRAAWLAIILMVFFVAFFFPATRAAIRAHLRRAAPYLLACLVLFGGYMALFLRSSIVTSSNTSRKSMTEIAFFYTLERPIFGYGPGMFSRVISDTEAYVMDFGDPPDAHGFLQKTAVETGIFGSILFTGFFVSVLVSLFRRARQSAENQLFFVAAFLSVCGSVLFQLFNTSYFQSHLWLPVGIACAGLLVFSSSYKESSV